MAYSLLQHRPRKQIHFLKGMFLLLHGYTALVFLCSDNVVILHGGEDIATGLFKSQTNLGMGL